MAGNVTISNTFATQSGPIPLSQLDTNFGQLVTAMNTTANFSNYYADSSGSANAVVVTVSSPQTFSYTAGATLSIKIANTNTGASTINVNSLGIKSITNGSAGALNAGDLTVGAVVTMIYDGTQFQLQANSSLTNPVISGSLTLSGGTANGVAYLNASKVLTTGSGFTYSSAGNLYLAAPSSGTAFNINTGSGAVAIAMGNWPVMQYTGTTWQLGGLNAAQFTDGKLYTDGVSRLQIATGGNVTINAPSSGTALTVNGGVVVSDPGTGASFTNAAGGNFNIGLLAGTGSAQAYIYQRANAALLFGTNNAEVARFDTSGNLGIGTSSPYNPNGTNLEIYGSSNDARLVLNAVSGSKFSIGSLAYGTALRFTNITTGSEMARFDNAGNLGIGTSSPTNKLQVNGAVYAQGDGSSVGYYLNAGSAIRTTGTGALYIDTATTTGTEIVFRPATTERMRLDSSGNLLVGTTSTGTTNSTSLTLEKANGYMVVNHVSGTASGAGYAIFGYNGSLIGSITQNGTTGVLYNISSDRRLKDNITDADSASDLIDAIKVRQFDWKSDGSHQRYGMIAQELHEVAPEAVHSPVDPDDMMAVDYSKLVPMLVKEIQSLRVRLNALENK